VAVCFHIAIQVSASVQVFSYLAVAALVIWAVPSTRDRTIELDLTATGAARCGRWIGALDWLARFRIVGAPPGAPTRVVDRDGAVFEGPAAVVLVASRLPVTAFAALPLRLLPWARRQTPRPAPGRDPALTASHGAP
jgi:hypothetical protein